MASSSNALPDELMASSSNALPDDLRAVTEDLVKNPNDVTLHTKRAEILANEGRYFHSKRQFDAACQINFNDTNLHESRLAFFNSLGGHEKATKEIEFVSVELRQVLEEQTKKIGAHTFQLSELRNSKKWPEALAVLQTLISLGVTNSKTLLIFKAEALMRVGNFGDAQEVLSNALKMEDEPVKAVAKQFCGMNRKAYHHLVIAHLQILVGKMKNALDEVEKARNLDPGNKEIADTCSNFKDVCLAYNKGKKMYGRGEYMEAKEQFMAALCLLKQKSISLWNSIAECQMQLGNWKQCETTSRFVLGLLPGDEMAKGLLELARIKLSSDLPTLMKKEE